MLEQKPFIHVFKSVGSYFVFDVNSDTVLKISKNIFEYLQNIMYTDNYSQDMLSIDDKNQLQRMKDDGYLSSNRPEEIIHPLNDTIEYYLDTRLNMLTLQVTQNCNLRCDYCVYSGNYEKNRSHTNNKMAFETAKKGIDFLLEHSMNNNIISIGFYGGEPLLEFDFIKKCVHYVEDTYEGKDVRFHMTTNGTLLNKSMIGFFEKHDFTILISLDGPKDVHDRFRRFPESKRSSFDTLINNLEEIKASNPRYFSKIRFNAVIDPENDLSCTNEFFASYDLIKDNVFMSSFVGGKYEDGNNKISIDSIIEVEYEKFKVFLYELNRLDKKNISIIQHNDFSLQKEIMRNKNKWFSKLDKKIHHSGPCIPGVSRLLMNVDGNLFPCERVDESSDDMIIGNVQDGFDIEKVKKLLNIGKLSEEDCKNCFALTHCGLCAKNTLDNSKISAEKKKSQCEKAKGTFNSFLKDYCALKELDYCFDKYLEVKQYAFNDKKGEEKNA